MEFLEKKDMLLGTRADRAAEPRVDPGEGESAEEEEESTGESSDKEGLKAKLTKARDEVKRLEKELTVKKGPSKEAKSKGKREGVKKKKKKPSPEAKRKKKKKKKKKKKEKGKASPS